MESTPPPVSLHRLTLSNVRCFVDFKLNFRSRPTTRGQWCVLLGANGVGKSSVLKSIAIALSPLRDLRRYPEGRLQRRGASAGRVVVETSGPTMDLSLDKPYREFGFDTPRVYAYGAGRGSAIGGPQRSVDLEHPVGPLSTLFGQPPGLIHAETWLQQLAFAHVSAQDQGGDGFFRGVKHTLEALLPGVDRLEVTPKGVLAVGPAVGRGTPLDGLSDGFLTTLGWVCDLIARWAYDHPDLAQDEAFHERMTGIVLVDELDLHLHPSWQCRVIGNLREAFPNLSFVVTTHNPQTLLGARDGEIVVLERDAHDIVARQQNLPAGIRADEVLTGPWFGLSTTVDPDTTKLMRDYQARVLDGAEPAELVEMESELRLRLGGQLGSAADWQARELLRKVLDGRPVRRRTLRALRAALEAMELA